MYLPQLNPMHAHLRVLQLPCNHSITKHTSAKPCLPFVFLFDNDKNPHNHPQCSKRVTCPPKCKLISRSMMVCGSRRSSVWPPGGRISRRSRWREVRWERCWANAASIGMCSKLQQQFSMLQNATLPLVHVEYMSVDKQPFSGSKCTAI